MIIYFWHRNLVLTPKPITMADDKRNTGKQDDIRVDANDASEVEYLHSQYPEKSHEEVKKAVEDYGPMRKDIEAHLSR
jgi:hypothetical protein